MDRVKRQLYIVMAALLLTACSGRYVGAPRAEMLAYQTGHTCGSLYAVAAAHAANLNAAVKADTLHPGMYAEYGVALALMATRARRAGCSMPKPRRFPKAVAW